MESSHDVVLLDFWASSFGMRLRIALAIKGIKYEAREQNIYDKSPFLLEMNPLHKKVPVLIHEGKPICESLIILEYVDEVWHDKYPLLPSDPYERSQARFLADYIDKKLYSTGGGLLSVKGEVEDEVKRAFIEILKIVEGELGDKPYFGGDNMGFVDVALVPFTSLFYSYETFANFSIEEECPKLVEWAKRCMEIEIVSNSLPHPHRVYDYVLDLKQKYGLA